MALLFLLLMASTLAVRSARLVPTTLTVLGEDLKIQCQKMELFWMCCSVSKVNYYLTERSFSRKLLLDSTLLWSWWCTRLLDRMGLNTDAEEDSLLA